jgi:long-chain fatty acid transport protein
VSGTSPILPIPTIAASYAFGKQKELTLAGGMFDPYFTVASFPETVNGQPSPARYSLGSLSGILAVTGLWAAYKPIEELRIGAGVMAMVGTFNTTVTFSASPQDRLLGAPEQPEFDAKAQLKVGPIFAPSANAGVTFVPTKMLRIGVSGQLPMYLSGPGTISMQMPSSAVFDGASQGGKDVSMSFTLPGIIRAGIEVRPIDELRIEATYVRELWTTQHAIDITSKNLSLLNVQGMPPVVNIPSISVLRNFDNSDSFRIGSEYFYSVGGYPLALRVGAGYETSAVPKQYLSLSSLDFNKWTLSIGGGLFVGKHWRFDGVYAHLFASSVYVDAATAGLGRINPIKGNATFEPVNGGTYTASADLIGLGLNYTF